jgi:4-alpha-glucanotransferase
MGLLDEAQAEREREGRQLVRKALAGQLEQRGLLDEQTPDEIRQVLHGALRRLSASPARTVLVNLEDCWLELESQNTPGTSTERINWRRKIRHSLEALMELPEVLELLREVNDIRKRARGD